LQNILQWQSATAATQKNFDFRSVDNFDAIEFRPSKST